MLDQARSRLEKLMNVDFALVDGQALTFPDESFDAVLCGMALMLFPDAGRGLAQFHRVLRTGGRSAVSVNTVPERSFVTRIIHAIGRHVPSRARAGAQYYSLGEWRYEFPSFEAYFGRFDEGWISGHRGFHGPG
jgi:ubiquinone/menaquinone biosynthesis C-methylase UbiE